MANPRLLCRYLAPLNSIAMGTLKTKTFASRLESKTRNLGPS